ncbi:tetratricopeptide repeat protein [Granulicella sp. dw_53]|uniref:tetratricopeptide repeat protein n=1 Tax=Granulicella sp. dw_53 TaxID=2719792 RepID=UPI001BD58A22|nr:tetratricopeptide repeat protein [Granulicella sp. dw_53]
MNRSVGRELAHQSPEWASIQQHLPDPATATSQQMELQADILRARRFPEDALEFYGYALKRGGDPGPLYKKMGVSQLELRNTVLAEMYFLKAVKVNRKDAEAWNNLGAVDYISHQYGAAVDHYKKAMKLDKNSAIYHSNLGMAYFDQKEYKKARKEIATALKLDPDIFKPKSNASGVSAHVLSPEDRARFCLEMAKTYAAAGNDAEMIHSLSMASENGMDLLTEMAKDKILASLRDDPRVLVLVQNQKALRAGQAGLTQVGAVEPLAAPVQ